MIHRLFRWPRNPRRQAMRRAAGIRARLDGVRAREAETERTLGQAGRVPGQVPGRGRDAGKDIS